MNNNLCNILGIISLAGLRADPVGPAVAIIIENRTAGINNPPKLSI
jgi:hypothetical protein